MALGKFAPAIVVALAIGMLWIEHDHRIVVATPASTDDAPITAACPDSDSVPFSADCIAFIEGGASSNIRAISAARPPEATHDRRSQADPVSPACPVSNENAPYSARCIKFLSGWYWQPNATARLDRAPGRDHAAMVSFTAATSCLSVKGFARNANCWPSAGRCFWKASSA
jgi:hypothetical protein